MADIATSGDHAVDVTQEYCPAFPTTCPVEDALDRLRPAQSVDRYSEDLLGYVFLSLNKLRHVELRHTDPRLGDRSTITTAWENSRLNAYFE
jgi:hypothetical protein